MAAPSPDTLPAQRGGVRRAIQPNPHSPSLSSTPRRCGRLPPVPLCCDCFVRGVVRGVDFCGCVPWGGPGGEKRARACTRACPQRCSSICWWSLTRRRMEKEKEKEIGPFLARCTANKYVVMLLDGLCYVYIYIYVCMYVSVCGTVLCACPAPHACMRENEDMHAPHTHKHTHTHTHTHTLVIICRGAAHMDGRQACSTHMDAKRDVEPHAARYTSASATQAAVAQRGRRRATVATAVAVAAEGAAAAGHKF
jgi:hypothetical protein